MNTRPTNPLLNIPASVERDSTLAGSSCAPRLGEADKQLGIFDIATTIQQLCRDGIQDAGLAFPAPSPDSPDKTTERAIAPSKSDTINPATQTTIPLPELDVLSPEYLTSIAQFLTKVTGRPVGLALVAKSGSLVQLADAGFSESLAGSKSLVQRIVKECSLRPAIRWSSDYKADRTQPGLGSVNLNRLSDILSLQLVAVPSSLIQSNGSVVCLLGSTAPNQGNVQETESQLMHWGLPKSTHAMILRSLDVWMQLQRSSRWLSLLKSFDWVLSRPRWWIVPVAVSCSLLLVPVPYYPKRECTIEPESKQYLASPIQGRIAFCDIRPGDQVEAGQLLAKLDDTELQRDLATATAEYDAAAKKFDSAIVARATGNAGLAEIEKQQAQRRIANISDQLKRLDIRAISPGIVVQGDWIRSIGVPVTMGQNLFEVAILESMTAELQLLASDLGHINVGDAVSIRSDASGGASFYGKINRIEPRATVKDDKAVFIADVVIRDQNRNLRPGMKATAHVQAGWKSIGWLLFDRPYRWIANQWIW